MSKNRAMSTTEAQGLKITVSDAEALIVLGPEAEAAKKAEAAQAEAWTLIRNQTPTVEGLSSLRALAEAWAADLKDQILAEARLALGAIQDTPFYTLSASERRNCVMMRKQPKGLAFYAASLKLGVKGSYPYDVGTATMMNIMDAPEDCLFIRGDGDDMPSWDAATLVAFERLAGTLNAEALGMLQQSDPVLHTRAHRLQSFVNMFTALPEWPGHRASVLAAEAQAEAEAAKLKAEAEAAKLKAEAEAAKLKAEAEAQAQALEESGK